LLTWCSYAKASSGNLVILERAAAKVPDGVQSTAVVLEGRIGEAIVGQIQAGDRIWWRWDREAVASSARCCSAA